MVCWECVDFVKDKKGRSICHDNREYLSHGETAFKFQNQIQRRISVIGMAFELGGYMVW